MRLISISIFFSMIFGLPWAQANSRKVTKPNSAKSSLVAAANSKAIPELIDFQDFQGLTKLQKEKYIQQLQNLLIYISDSSSWETASLRTESKWNLLLEQFLETADARGLTQAQRDMMNGKCPSGFEWVRSGRSYSCKAKLSCPMGSTLVQVAEDGKSCQTMAIAGNCPTGFLPQVDGDSGTTYCLPSSALRDEKVVQHEAGSSPPPPVSTGNEVGKKSGENNSREIGKPKMTEEERQAGMAELGDRIKNPGKYLKDSAEKPEQSAGEGKPATKCWWEEVKKCETSTKKRKAIAKEWYKSKPKDGELSCIYAGHVSAYKNAAKPSPGECKPTTELQFGGKTFKCPVGQSICNPLVFGVKDMEKEEGICTKGSNATQECAKKGSAANTVGQLQSLGASAGAEWDRLKEGLKKIVASCILEDKEKNSVTINTQAFQCQECQVIATRVAEMRNALNSKLSELNCELSAKGSVAEVAGSSDSAVSAPKARGTR